MNRYYLLMGFIVLTFYSLVSCDKDVVEPETPNTHPVDTVVVNPIDTIIINPNDSVKMVTFEELIGCWVMVEQEYENIVIGTAFYKDNNEQLYFTDDTYLIENYVICYVTPDVFGPVEKWFNYDTCSYDSIWSFQIPYFCTDDSLKFNCFWDKECVKPSHSVSYNIINDTLILNNSTKYIRYKGKNFLALDGNS